ncbi:hypertrehalosaemic prohormone [Xylocopa sonorina]|uniref:hypertrehalosaemic prohormone n=1 Tax=Xylocopa sonorina TaxID=1818115 RepID=UPI00403AA4FF
MCRKIRLGFLAIILLLWLALDFGAEAQLNFSTGWGKRSQRIGVVDWGGARTECSLQARPSMEQLLTFYNLIQAEARRMLDCRKLNE